MKSRKNCQICGRLTNSNISFVATNGYVAYFCWDHYPQFLFHLLRYGTLVDKAWHFFILAIVLTLAWLLTPKLWMALLASRALFFENSSPLHKSMGDVITVLWGASNLLVLVEYIRKEILFENFLKGIILLNIVVPTVLLIIFKLVSF